MSRRWRARGQKGSKCKMFFKEVWMRRLERLVVSGEVADSKKKCVCVKET